ncbi:MAG: hypothetical protein AAB602_03505 [Patescibacteria group bacterium]
MDISQGDDAGLNVPPAPPEVRVRTFQSDLLSMKESGSGLPQFQKVIAPRLPIGDDKNSVIPLVVSQKAMPFLIAVVLIALAIIGYLVYAIFFGGARQNETSQAPAQIENGGQIVEQSPVQSISFTHLAPFKKPVDQKIPLVLSQAVSSASDLQTYSQRFESALSKATLTAKFVEMEARGDGEKSMGLTDVFSAAGTLVLDEEFFTKHFDSDITIFAYREGGDFWPGYVLALNSDENWLFLKSEIEKLEVSQNVMNFFLNPPEERGAFNDGEISGQPVRIANFSSGLQFVYGWARGYLILSTSRAGFSEAVGRL